MYNHQESLTKIFNNLINLTMFRSRSAHKIGFQLPANLCTTSIEKKEGSERKIFPLATRFSRIVPTSHIYIHRTIPSDVLDPTVFFPPGWIEFLLSNDSNQAGNDLFVFDVKAQYSPLLRFELIRIMIGRDRKRKGGYLAPYFSYEIIRRFLQKGRARDKVRTGFSIQFQSYRYKFK